MTQSEAKNVRIFEKNQTVSTTILCSRRPLCPKRLLVNFRKHKLTVMPTLAKPTLAKPTLAKRGLDRLWPNRLWPILVFQSVDRLWPNRLWPISVF